MRLVPILIPLLALGCSKPVPSTHATAAVTGGLADAPRTPAVADAAAATPGGRDAGVVDAGVVDVPAWPTGTRPGLKLTWAVYPRIGQGETSRRNVELVARIGNVARRVPLGSSTGVLFPYNQSVCGEKQIAYKKVGAEVAKLTFYIGGSTSFIVKRPTPGMLQLEMLAATDGYCPKNDCDVRTWIANIPVPEDARVIEAVSDVEAPGKEAPLDCSGLPR